MFPKEATESQSKCPLPNTTACFISSPTETSGSRGHLPIVKTDPVIGWRHQTPAPNLEPKYQKMGPGPCSRTQHQAHSYSPIPTFLPGNRCWLVLTSKSKEVLQHLVALVLLQRCWSQAGSTAPHITGQNWPRSLPSPSAQHCTAGVNGEPCGVWGLCLNPALSPLQSCQG